MADWRGDPRWTLLAHDESAWTAPPERPTPTAERSADHTWASQYEKRTDENGREQVVIVATWVLTGPTAAEARAMRNAGVVRGERTADRSHGTRPRRTTSEPTDDQASLRA